MQPGAVLTFGSTPSDESTSWTIVTTTLKQLSTVGAIAVKGWNIALPTVTSSSASTTPSTSSSPTSLTALPTSSPSISPSISPSSSSTPSSSLSAGVKAGIGVGVALGVLGLIALISALFLLRRRKQKTDRDPQDAQNGGQPNVAQIPPGDMDYHVSEAHELPAKWVPPELASNCEHMSPVELDTHRPY
ncbi:hypothetical protein V2W45_1414103 [Cenococcum geophilum]